MPKEVIRDIDRMYNAEVSWSRESNYVQFAVFTQDGRSILANLGLDGVGRDTGLYSTLGPDEIDRLIKVLKKAKKQAFGA